MCNKAVPSFRRFQRIAKAEIQDSRGAFLADRRGWIWRSTESGQLFLYFPVTRRLERMSGTSPTPDGLWSGKIEALAEDQEEMIWIGQSNGLFRFDPAHWTHIAYLHDPADSNTR